MFYPLVLDVFYSTTTQNELGELIHVWTYDRTIPCRTSSNTNYKDQNIFPDQRLRVVDQINAQIVEDIRIDSFGENHPLTDMLVGNIRAECETGTVYKETAGDRSGLGTLYEVIGYMPHVDPFNRIDYIKIVMSRADEQALL